MSWSLTAILCPTYPIALFSICQVMPPLNGTNPAKQCKKLVLPLPLLPLITNKFPENNLKDIGITHGGYL